MEKNIWSYYRKAIDWMKEYGLPTVTILAPFVYFFVYDVNPLYVMADIRDKHDQVDFHNATGKAMLKSGFYAKAKEEYEWALRLNPASSEGQEGRYLAGMFMDLDSADWNPSIGMNIGRRLISKNAKEYPGYREIFIKYQGDVYLRIENDSIAERYYDCALRGEAGKDYQDALFSKGWLLYSKGAQESRRLTQMELEKMSESFRLMTENDAFDFRGFHGYGYCLFMRAVRSTIETEKRILLDSAAEQSRKAKSLGTNELHVLLDLGLIARPVYPKISVYYHELAEKLLLNPKLSSLRDNTMVLGSCLQVTDSKCLSIETHKQKLAWVRYQLSLDYESLHRLEADSSDFNARMSDTLLSQARELDPDAHVLPLYIDQLQVLAQFAPPRPRKEAR